MQRETHALGEELVASYLYQLAGNQRLWPVPDGQWYLITSWLACQTPQIGDGIFPCYKSSKEVFAHDSREYQQIHFLFVTYRFMLRQVAQETR